MPDHATLARITVGPRVRPRFRLRVRAVEYRRFNAHWNLSSNSNSSSTWAMFDSRHADVIAMLLQQPSSAAPRDGH